MSPLEALQELSGPDGRSGASADASSPLRGGGSCGQLMRSIDWSRTPLGPVEQWPAQLRTTVSTLLHSRHPMFLWWGPELIQFYNDAYAPSFGIGKHPTAMGQRGAECWPEIWSIIHPQIRDVMDRGIASWNENQLVPIFRNGRIEDVYWTYSYSPVFGDDGRVAGTLVVCTETTRAVRSAEANRILTQLIPQQVWRATPEGDLDYVNERILTYFAKTEAEMLGGGWHSVLHPDDLPTCIERWNHSLATGEEYEVEFRLRRADGAYRWHLGRALSLCDPGGKVVKWFGTNTDIHEAKRIREDLKTRNDFEQHLLGIASHDLRNPLNAIILTAAALTRREDVDERATRAVLRIQSAAERASRMVKDLLDFTQARLGSGIPVSPRPIELRTVVQQVIVEVEASFPDGKIRMESVGDVLGSWDADRLAQVVTNLLSNALKYGSPGADIEVRIAGAGDSVLLEVHNLGPPIPADEKSRLFQPMHRMSPGSDPSGRSVGLGLYIVKSIVEAHEGQIDVRSSEEEGTTFSITLPRRTSAALEHGR